MKRLTTLLFCAFIAIYLLPAVSNGAGPGGRGGAGAGAARGGGRSLPAANRGEEGLSRSNLGNLEGSKLDSLKSNGTLEKVKSSDGLSNAKETIRNSDQFQQKTTSLKQQADSIKSNVQQQWKNGPQPFTPSWYAQHPNAWHATHPYAPPPGGVVAWVGVTAWLGWPAAAPVTYDYNNYSTTVYYSVDPTAENAAAAEQKQQAQQASQIAAQGKKTDITSDDWMALGNYALASEGQAHSHIMLELAVNKQGVLRGSYYDALSNATHDITGYVDQKTQRAAWTVESNPTTVFETGLNNLTQDQSPLLIHRANNQTQKWTMVRMETKQ